MTDAAMQQYQPRTTKAAATALCLIGLVAVLAALFGGMRGVQHSESFGFDDLTLVDGGMYLHHIDIANWPEPPFYIVDDGRLGAEGSLTQLSVNGRKMGVARASRQMMVEGNGTAFLHTGVRNLYLSPGPAAGPDSRFTVSYRVQLERSVWIAAAGAGLLIVLAGLCLLAGLSRLFDAMLILLLIATAAGTWLAWQGVAVQLPVPTERAGKKPPHGYAVRLEPLWPLVFRASDRLAPLVNGRLLLDGDPTGPSLSTVPEIRAEGNGAHVLGNNGTFHFSLPGNPPSIADASGYRIEARLYLPTVLTGIAGAGFVILLTGGLVSGRSQLLGAARDVRPRTSASVLVISIAATVTGYLGWLIWIDALHMWTAPGERDWFTRNEGWRMAGLVRTYPYETIIVGTSVSQNFYMQEAGEVLGAPVLNATMAGSTLRVPALRGNMATARHSIRSTSGANGGNSVRM